VLIKHSLNVGALRVLPVTQQLPMDRAITHLAFLSTVPPTAGLVAKFFGPSHMATLFRLMMVTYQVGGLLGAWLGGQVFQATGGLAWLWYADIVLAHGAALFLLPIREASSRPQPATQESGLR
jgi:predicted MFS family arabinose efflux permease